MHPFVLYNLFDAATESERGWESAVRGELCAACKALFPPAEPCFSKLDAPGGALLLEFSSTDEAAVAVNALHWRWFGGRRVTAQYIDELDFHRRI